MTFDWSVRPHADQPPAAERAAPEARPAEVAPLPRRVERVKRSRVSSRMPVPTPRPEAVTAGNFGLSEHGKPIRPSADEVRDITENHAYMLMNIVVEHANAQDDDRDRLAREFEAGIAKYAEDFGTPAAARLRAHVQKIAAESLPALPRGR